MVFPVAIVVGLVFGGADNYLGSLDARGLWTVSLSLLSAPWLLLPFVFGCSQLLPKRAAAAGLVATLAALLGYFLMILGPLEGGRWSMNLHEIDGLWRSNVENVLGGFVTGPLYGLLGQMWRARRAWISAVLVAGALCLEPVALSLAGRRYYGDSVVWPFEVACGIALAGYFLLAGVAFRRRAEHGLAKRT